MWYFLSVDSCPALIIINGEVDYDQDPVNDLYPIGTNASYRCNHGYRIEGSSSRTCQDTGTWNQQTPVCNRGKWHVLQQPSLN